MILFLTGLYLISNQKHKINPEPFIALSILEFAIEIGIGCMYILATE